MNIKGNKEVLVQAVPNAIKAVDSNTNLFGNSKFMLDALKTMQPEIIWPEYTGVGNPFSLNQRTTIRRLFS